MRTQVKKRVRKRRVSNGVYLVEVLVALGLGALLAFFLLNALSTSMQLARTTQNEVMANAILGELQEWTRAVGYKYLADPTFPPSIKMLVNRTSANEPGSDPLKRTDPLMLDQYLYQWSDKTISGKFPGEVFYSVERLDADTLKVSIKVSWSDSTWSADNSESSLGKGRVVQTSLFVSRMGLGAYQ